MSSPSRPLRSWARAATFPRGSFPVGSPLTKIPSSLLAQRREQHAEAMACRVPPSPPQLDPHGDLPSSALLFGSPREPPVEPERSRHVESASSPPQLGPRTTLRPLANRIIWPSQALMVVDASPRPPKPVCGRRSRSV